MNVLVVSDHGFGEGGGIGTYSRVLVKLLRSLGIRAIPFSWTLNTSLAGTDLTRCFEKLLAKYGIDLIHANVLRSRVAMALSNIAEALKIPVVVTVHTYVYVCPIELFVQLPSVTPCNKMGAHQCLKCIVSDYKYKSKILPLHGLARIPRSVYDLISFNTLLQKASAIIAPSKKLASILSERYPGKVYRLPNPIDSTLLEAKPTEYNANGPLLFVGRLEWYKGVHVAVLTAMRLRRRITIVGSGSMHNYVKDLSSHTPLIEFRGLVSMKHLNALYREASIVLAPSICCESWGYVVSEALTFARPVVSFDLCGSKEQVEASGGGMLARYFDVSDFISKVRYLLDNPRVAEEMGLRGRRYVERTCSPQRYGKALEAVYQRVLSHRQRYAW